MFASRTVKTIPIPFDPPNTVTIQRLPGRHLERAAQVSMIEAQEYVAKLGGVEFRKQLKEAAGAGAKDKEGEDAEIAKAIKEAQSDPLNGYHKPTIIKFGVKAWTYDLPVNDESIADLEDEAEDFLAREVLRLTKPALFMTEEEAKATQKETDADSSGN